MGNLAAIDGRDSTSAVCQAAGKATAPPAFAELESMEVELRSSQGHLLGPGDVGTGDDFPAFASPLEQHDP